MVVIGAIHDKGEKNENIQILVISETYLYEPVAERLTEILYPVPMV